MAPMFHSLTNQTLDNTIGATLLGVVGASFLFGITTLQAYWYYHHYRTDSMLHKCAVPLLWTLDAFHLALTIHTIYTYTISDFGNPVALFQIPWTMKLQVVVNVVIILIVHSLYALRVWLLGDFHQGFLGYLVASVVTGGFVIGAVLAYSLYTIHTYLEINKISWVITAALGTSTSIDFVLAAAMCYYLRKSKGGLTRLNSRISTVMKYTLSSGLFTSACSLLAMFTYLLLPNTLIFVALGFLLTKLYVSSFLSMLNSREHKSSKQSFDQAGATVSITWQNNLKIQTPTSSFWSPQLQSAVLNGEPLSPMTSITATTKTRVPSQRWS